MDPRIAKALLVILGSHKASLTWDMLKAQAMLESGEHPHEAALEAAIRQTRRHLEILDDASVAIGEQHPGIEPDEQAATDALTMAKACREMAGEPPEPTN
ncbi:MAG: hypothetical protein VW405_02830 [Rhodospirillaceae bacterium]